VSPILFVQSLQVGTIFFLCNEEYSDGYAVMRTHTGLSLCCDVLPAEIFLGPTHSVNSAAKNFLAEKERVWIHVFENPTQDRFCPSVVIWQMRKPPCRNPDRVAEMIEQYAENIGAAVPVLLNTACEVFPAWQKECGSAPSPMDCQFFHVPELVGEA